jgi:hypothetical protein
MHFKEEPVVEEHSSFAEGSSQVISSRSRPTVELLRCLLVAVHPMVDLWQIGRKILLDLYPPPVRVGWGAGAQVCLTSAEKARVKEKPKSLFLYLWGGMPRNLRAKVPEENPRGALLPDLLTVSAEHNQGGCSRRRIQGSYDQLC